MNERVRIVEEKLRIACQAAEARGVKIVPGQFNLMPGEDGLTLPRNNRCCAVGALLLGQPWHEDMEYVQQAAELLEIQPSRVWEIVCGFDGRGQGRDDEIDEFKFLGTRLSDEFGKETL